MGQQLAGDEIRAFLQMGFSEEREGGGRVGRRKHTFRVMWKRRGYSRVMLMAAHISMASTNTTAKRQHVMERGVEGLREPVCLQYHPLPLGTTKA